tara:strand:- start:1111 stop:1335 length:225 start_codon:yes stop_codon:yes gene_type:complete
MSPQRKKPNRSRTKRTRNLWSGGGGKYYIEHYKREDTTISWNDNKDRFLLTVNNKPIGAFPSLEGAKKYYEREC